MSAVYVTSHDRPATDCPLCGQEVVLERRGKDFELRCRGGCGDVEVRKEIDAAVMLELGQYAKARTNGGGRNVARATPVSEFEAEPVSWLVDGLIPLDNITMLAGNPGLGKSMLTVEIAAGVTTGRLLGTPASVLISSAEDSVRTTIRPRLEAAGADIDLVRIIEVGPPEEGEPPNLPDNVPAVERLVEKHEAKLVVIDPFMAHLPASVNSWKDQSVRRALAPLKRLAERHSCAVVIVGHLNKAQGVTALQRLGGSGGIPAAARSALLLDRNPDDPRGELGNERVLAHIKCNVAPMAQSQRWDVVPVDLGEINTARITYVGASEHQSQDLLDRVTTGEERTALDETETFFLAELADGPRPTRDVWRAADANGISKATFKRARQKLGVESRKEEGVEHGAWTLRLPQGDQGVHDQGAHAHMDQMSPLEQTQSQSGIEGAHGVQGAHRPDIEPLRLTDGDSEASGRRFRCSCLRPDPGLDGQCQRCFGYDDTSPVGLTTEEKM